MLSHVTGISIEKALAAEIDSLPAYDQQQIKSILHSIRDCLVRLADELLSAELIVVPVGDLNFWFVRRQILGLEWGLVNITDDSTSPDQPPTGESLRIFAEFLEIYGAAFDLSQVNYVIPIDDGEPSATVDRLTVISRSMFSGVHADVYGGYGMHSDVAYASQDVFASTAGQALESDVETSAGGDQQQVIAVNRRPLDRGAADTVFHTSSGSAPTDLDLTPSDKPQ